MRARREEPKRIFAHVRVPGLEPSSGRAVAPARSAPKCARAACQEALPGRAGLSPAECLWPLVMEVCGDYTVHIWAQPTTREVTLDLTGLERLFGPPQVVGREIRNRLRGELGLDSAVGIGAAPVVAQLASRAARVGEVLEVPEKASAAFVGQAPVAALPGVEADWARWLGEIGIRTARDLAALPVEAVIRTFGERGRRAWEIARGGEPDQIVQAAAPPVAEETLTAQVDLHPPSDERTRIRAALHVAAGEITRQLRQRGKAARQVRLELVFIDLRQVELRRTLPCATGETKAFFQAARALVDRVRLSGRQVRRVRMRALHLVLDEQGGQLPLPLTEGRTERPRMARPGRFQPVRAAAG